MKDFQFYSELLDPSFLFALDNGEKFSIQPMRFSTLLRMTRVKVRVTFVHLNICNGLSWPLSDFSLTFFRNYDAHSQRTVYSIRTHISVNQLQIKYVKYSPKIEPQFGGAIILWLLFRIN